jgi:hypothetical protein
MANYQYRNCEIEVKQHYDQLYYVRVRLHYHWIRVPGKGWNTEVGANTAGEAHIDELLRKDGEWLH